jgi:Tfp pilus assembly protein PilV
MMHRVRGYTLLEALIAANLLALALIMLSKVLIAQLAQQHTIKQQRMAILSVYSAQALSALPATDPRWERWREQLNHHMPGAELSEQEGLTTLCWKEDCL